MDFRALARNANKNCIKLIATRDIQKTLNLEQLK
jgi:hypothetical protein